MPFLSDFAVFRCLFFYYYIISLLVYSVSCQIANGKRVILQLFSDFFYKFTVFSRFSCSHSKKINNCGEPIQGHQKSVNRQMPSEKKQVRQLLLRLAFRKIKVYPDGDFFNAYYFGRIIIFARSDAGNQ